MSDYSQRKERQFNLWGWLLFLVCAAFFIASAVTSGDVLYLTGSIIFLLACLLFLVPLLKKQKTDKDA
ncbi:MAG: hypothetical protein ABH934_02725 [Chloroflexota bacterium]